MIAEKLGLPGWIVELRHEATHNQLPSLQILKAAANFLINW
jgi:ribosomal biogenesis protein LAS1